MLAFLQRGHGWRPASQLLSLGPSTFTRGRAQLAPRKVEHIKRHKGRIPIPIGGSIKGTTLAFGTWGIRIKGNGVRLSAKQLTTAEEAIKRKIKIIKGSKVYMRVFPHIPVCVKVCFPSQNLFFPFMFDREMKLAWVKGRAHSNFGQLGRFLISCLRFSLTHP